MRRFLFAIGVLIAAVGLTSTAFAQASLCDNAAGNLVVNCGFESGAITGWTLTGNTTNPPGGFNGSEYGVGAYDANSGTKGLYLGPIGLDADLSQAITMVANTAYSISFYLKQYSAADINSNHEILVTLENPSDATVFATLLDLTDPAPFGSFVQYTATFTPTAAQLGGSVGQVALVFEMQNDDSYWGLDDVEVTSTLPTITKAFSPSSIPPGGTSTVTLTLGNGALTARTSAAFTDTLVNMSASGGAVTGTCGGTTPATLTAGATALSFSGITIPATSICTVIFNVTSSASGMQPNTTSGVTTAQTSMAGSPSNTAILAVLVPPTISKAFNPTSIASSGTSVVTLTLANSNAVALTGGALTDTLANMQAAGGAVGGACVGTTPSTLAAGATALSFSGITIPASGSCTVTFGVTSTTAGPQPNTTSGATTTQTPTAGAGSNTATLTVLGGPAITKAFNPNAILPGANSVVTLTLANPTPAALTGGAFTDALTNMSAFGGAVGGTCSGTSPTTLSGGATALSFSGITIPSSGSCTVTFTVTSTTTGTQPNATSGVTTTQTTTAGAPSNTANLYVLVTPTITKGFSPQSIISGQTSTVTLTLANGNGINLTGGAVSDTLANMSAVAGPVGGTCVGTTPTSLSAGATSVSFSGITIPANSSCTVTFSVTSTILGPQPNITSGVTTTQTPTAGSPSNTPSLIVYAVPTISKAFNPAAINSGGTSVVTVTLSNTNPNTLAGANFSDTLVNMSAAGGAVTGTCVGTAPSTLPAGTTAVGFGSISIPSHGSCTVIFSVTSSTLGMQNNTTSGVTTSQTPTAGPPSNTAALTVSAAPTISKAFNPTSIQSGASSVVTLTLANTNSSALTGGALTDTLTNMSASGGAVGGTCTGTTPSTLAAGATALSFSGITIPASSSCTVTFSVTSSNLAANPNTTSGVTTTQTPTAGTASNAATLTVTAGAAPTISKSFNPTSIQSGGTSVVTLTLSNSVATARTGGAFTDTLTNMSASGGAVGGTCAGTTPTTLTAGATALSFSGITIPASGSCTVTFSVTSSTAGVQNNTTSGVTTTQTPTAGAASNTANLTVLAAPTIGKAFNPTSIQSGASSVVTLTLANTNSSALTGGALTDTLTNMSASGGAVGGTCSGTTPSTLTAGATALSFSGITIPASGSCTVTFSVTSSNVAGNPNTTSGVTTAQTPTSGPVSNTATLTVTASVAVANVTSSAANGTYGVGSVLPIQVTFSSAVVVTGTPQLALNSGGTASYSSGSGTSTLTFTYTVASGQNSIHLDYSGTSALTLNGGTINSGGNPASLTLPAPGAAGSLSANTNIVINTTSPTVINVTSSTANGTYGTGTVIPIQVTLSTAVVATGTPQLALNSGGTASYTSGSGTSTLTFTYTVAAGQNSTHLDYSGTSALTLNGGTIKDTAGNSAVLTLPAPGAAGSLSANKNIVINTSPTITNVTSSAANGTYGTGAVIPIQVTFSTAVALTGTPQLALNSGGIASYTSGSGTSTLTFTYTVAAGQNSVHLDYTSTSALTLNGGTISSGGSPAILTLPAPGAAGSLSGNTNIVINTTPPTVTNVTSTAANGSYGVAAVIPIQVTFSGAVTVTGTPQLALNSGGAASYTSGSGTSTLTFTYTVAAGQNSAHLDYSGTSALALNGGTINSGGSPANLALPAPGAAGSLSANKNLVIDTVAPTVVSYSVLFGSQSINMATSTRNRLPWAIAGVRVVFSKPVNAATASLSGLTATGVSGAGTNTVTWTLNPVTNLPSTVTKILGTGPNPVTDLAGNRLGGGVDFNQALKVLTGDYNDDGVVNATDLLLVNAARSQPYNIFADINGDGVVDANDVNAVRAQLGNNNP